MNDAETSAKWWRRLKLSHILLMVLVVLIAAYAFWRVRMKSKIRAKLDSIRAAGYPVTLEELDASYSIPESAENAAYTLMKAFSCYVQWKRQYLTNLPIAGRAELPPRTKPLSEETKALIADYLADNKKALELLHKGAAIGHCRYLTEFSYNMMLLPHLSDIKTGARLLALEAVLHAEKGESQSAVGSLILSFSLANSLADEPIWVSQFVRISCEGVSTSALERILNRVEVTDEQLIEISETLSVTETRARMRRGLAGDVVLGIGLIRSAPAEEIQHIDIAGRQPPTVPAIFVYRALGLVERDLLIYLDVMKQYAEVMELPLHERKRAAEVVQAKAGEVGGSHILFHVFCPSFAFAGGTTIELRGIGRLRVARTALGVERYRLASGKLPESLDELVPQYLEAIAKDPFDGEELRYKKLEQGFVVYSIGEDEIDDGGREKQGKAKAETGYDITFIVER